MDERDPLLEALHSPLLAQRMVDSPLGALRLVADRHTIRALRFEEPAALAQVRPTAEGVAPRAALRLLDRLERELRDYFAGRRRDFDLPLAARGTPFQERVWEELRRIPWGATRSYGEIARSLGMPGAARAVGHANNKNPIAIVIPCHRVIGADRRLVGYGGGIDKKVALLELEGVLPAATRAVAAGAAHG